jgi:hypothetical protein
MVRNHPNTVATCSNQERGHAEMIRLNLQMVQMLELESAASQL